MTGIEFREVYTTCKLRNDMKILIFFCFIDLEAIEHHGMKIFDGFAASGVRSIRLAKELPKHQIQFIHANDIDNNVVDTMKYNIQHNLGDGSLVTPMCHDTREYLHGKYKSYDIIDIDPYGTPTSMIDPSLHAISEGGMLCLTATDMLSLCGMFPTTSFVDYDALSMNGENCHEMGLRILLGFIAKRASKMKKTIVPLLSVSVGHYMRVFVQVYYDASASSRLATQMGHVYRCNECNSIEVEPIVKLVEVRSGGHWIIDGKKYKPHHRSISYESNCTFCGGPKKQFGPAWMGEIHHETVAKELHQFFRDNHPDNPLTPLLGVVSRELPTPFSHLLPRYASRVKTNAPSMVCVSCYTRLPF